MTREKATEVSNLIFKVETYEQVIDEIRGLSSLSGLAEAFGECDLEDELVELVQKRIDIKLKELEEM